MRSRNLRYSDYELRNQLFLVLANNMMIYKLLVASLVVAATASNLRHAATLANALAEWRVLPEFTAMAIKPAPPTSESVAQKAARLTQLHTVGQKQKMFLSSGTTVTLWAPDQLTPQELAAAAQTVHHLATEISDCFCTFRAKRPALSIDGLKSSIEPNAQQNCVCSVRGKLSESVPDLAPTDFYGTTLAKETTMQSLLRYDVPIGTKYTLPMIDQLELSMDAGDR